MSDPSYLIEPGILFFFWTVPFPFLRRRFPGENPIVFAAACAAHATALAFTVAARWELLKGGVPPTASAGAASYLWIGMLSTAFLGIMSLDASEIQRNEAWHRRREAMKVLPSEQREETAPVSEPEREEILPPADAPKEKGIPVPSPEQIVRESLDAGSAGGFMHTKAHARLRDLERKAEAERRATNVAADRLWSQTRLAESYVGSVEYQEALKARLNDALNPRPAPEPPPVYEIAEVVERVEVLEAQYVEPVPARGPAASPVPVPSDPSLCRKVAGAILRDALGTPHAGDEAAFTGFFLSRFPETHDSLKTVRTHADREESLRIALENLRKVKEN